MQTKKHKIAQQLLEGVQCKPINILIDKKIQCECGRYFKHQSGLSRHRKKCNNYQDLKTMFLDVVEENKELRNVLLKQQEQIDVIIPKIGNVTNNTFNLQMFLNENCKDALNMADFIRSLNIHIEDLEHTKKHGLCEGLTNIFVNGLKELGTYMRPIHCTDVKRETLYIKDNDQWGKETTCDNLKKSLYLVADKQRKAIKQWEESNPEWEESEKGKQQWILLVKNVMDTLDDETIIENKIIKNIAKEIKI